MDLVVAHHRRLELLAERDRIRHVVAMPVAMSMVVVVVWRFRVLRRVPPSVSERQQFRRQLNQAKTFSFPGLNHDNGLPYGRVSE